MARKSHRTKQHVVIKSSKGHTRAHVSLRAVPSLEKFRRDMESARRQKERKDLAESLDFLGWLSKQPTLPFGADVSWDAPDYRLMYGGAPVWSILGSFGAGGRFNPGMAQMSAHFPNLKAQGCLYMASTLECCYAEAPPPYGDPQQFELAPQRPFVLWDMKKVLRHYGDPVLEQRVLNTPLDAIWSHQKVPMTSQLLAAELRRIGGDGIIMPSTKRTNDSTIALFFDSDTNCVAALTPSRMNRPHPVP